LYFDRTKVDANAAINSKIDRTKSRAEQHLEELLKKNKEEVTNSTLQDLVEKYNGERFTGLRKPSYKRVIDEKVTLSCLLLVLLAMICEGANLAFSAPLIARSLMVLACFLSSFLLQLCGDMLQFSWINTFLYRNSRRIVPLIS
jgi:Flp pilus assembly protein TadB